MLEKSTIYAWLKNSLFPTDVAEFYLGEPDRIQSESLVYYSPLRETERTPSFFVNDEKGIHDFGTGIHYNIISFVANLFEINYYEASQKLIKDFELDINEAKTFELIPKKIDFSPKIEMVKGKEPKEIICSFDEVCYREKPQNSKDFVGIKNRIVNNNFTVYSNVNEVIEEVLDGRTCIPSGIRGSPEINWKQQQVFMIDFDNKLNGVDLTIDDSNHISEQEILTYCKNQNILPTFIYNTFTNSENCRKYRLVYVLEEPIKDLTIARQIPLYLLDRLKNYNPDISKKNLTDMFLGGVDIFYKDDNYYKIKIMEVKDE